MNRVHLPNHLASWLEPNQVPPPAYRNSAVTEDSWSTFSGSTQGMGKRRSSWSNLVEVGDPLNTGLKLVPSQAALPQKLPPPRPAPPMSMNYSASRTSSEMGMLNEIFTTYSNRTIASERIDLRAHVRAVNFIDGDGHPAAQRTYAVDPRLVSAPRPAGTIHSSLPGTAASSVILAPAVEVKSPSVATAKRNRLQDLFKWIKRPRNVLCCMLMLLLIIIAIVIAIVLSQVLPLPKQATFNWNAPGEVSNGMNATSNVLMAVQSSSRIRFQMAGAAPFKGNFINYYDFNANQAVVIDQSLQVNGRNLYCFVMPIDRTRMQNSHDIRRAAANSVSRRQMTEGWQESWTWIPSPMQGGAAFNPPIPECNGSRIVMLQQTGDQRNRRCTDCYDFCLPEYGAMRDTAKNENYLNIVRRDCFYLFVPEWRTYAQANTIEQNQKDFENYYRNRQHMQVNYGSGTGPNESRWISLSGIPRTIANATGSFVGAVGQAAGDFRNTVFGGNNQNQNPNAFPPPGANQGYPGQSSSAYGGQNQGQNYGPSFGNNNMSMTGPNPQNMNPASYNNNNNNNNPNVNGFYGHHPSVNGVVNLNGVNGNSGPNEYNSIRNPFATGNNPGQPSQGSMPQNLNVNSGFTSNPQISSGNTDMNGFGAQPSYVTSQFGFQNGNPNNPNSNQNSNTNRQVNPQTYGDGHNMNGVSQSMQQQQTPSSQLNLYGNPMSSSFGYVNQQPYPPTGASAYGNGLTGYGNPNFAANVPGADSYTNTNNNQQPLSPQLRSLMANLGSGSPSGYQPNAAPADYNTPNYNLNRPDTVGRQGKKH